MYALIPGKTGKGKASTYEAKRVLALKMQFLDDMLLEATKVVFQFGGGNKITISVHKHMVAA